MWCSSAEQSRDPRDIEKRSTSEEDVRNSFSNNDRERQFSWQMEHLWLEIGGAGTAWIEEPQINQCHMTIKHIIVLNGSRKDMRTIFPFRARPQLFAWHLNAFMQSEEWKIGFNFQQNRYIPFLFCSFRPYFRCSMLKQITVVRIPRSHFTDVE